MYLSSTQLVSHSVFLRSPRTIDCNQGSRGAWGMSLLLKKLATSSNKTMEDDAIQSDLRETRSERRTHRCGSNSSSDAEEHPSDTPARPTKQRRTRHTPPPLDKETPQFAFHDKAKKPPGHTHICPFPACPTHRNTPRNWRDAIKLHLTDI